MTWTRPKSDTRTSSKLIKPRYPNPCGRDAIGVSIPYSAGPYRSFNDALTPDVRKRPMRFNPLFSGAKSFIRSRPALLPQPEVSVSIPYSAGPNRSCRKREGHYRYSRRCFCFNPLFSGAKSFMGTNVTMFQSPIQVAKSFMQGYITFQSPIQRGQIVHAATVKVSIIQGAKSMAEAIDDRCFNPLFSGAISFIGHPNSSLLSNVYTGIFRNSESKLAKFPVGAASVLAEILEPA